MVFTVADRIVRLSGDTTPLAGALLPAGVGFAAGDEVSIEIEGIGRLTSREEVA